MIHKKLFLCLWAVLSLSLCNAQTVAELNAQSKVLLGEHKYREAFPLLKKAAEMGSAEAQYNYAVCFEQGIEVKKDDSTANVWLRKSAEQGWIDAQFKIAYSYAFGRGVAQDYVKAFEWTKRCALQNDPECIMNLITFYQQGVGTEKSIARVIEWATRLGRQEAPAAIDKSVMITSARYNLALMYLEGVEVPQSYLESYKWFLLTNENKNDFSIAQQQQIIEQVKNCEAGLTEKDKKLARRKAEALIGRSLKKHALLYREEM